MTAPKLNLRREVKNGSGRRKGNVVAVMARHDIGEFKFEDQIYTSAHIACRLDGVEITLRQKGLYKIGGWMRSRERWDLFYNGDSMHRFIDHLVATFKEGKIPEGLRLERQNWGWVLV